MSATSFNTESFGSASIDQSTVSGHSNSVIEFYIAPLCSRTVVRAIQRIDRQLLWQRQFDSAEDALAFATRCCLGGNPMVADKSSKVTK